MSEDGGRELCYKFTPNSNLFLSFYMTDIMELVQAAAALSVAHVQTEIINSNCLKIDEVQSRW